MKRDRENGGEKGGKWMQGVDGDEDMELEAEEVAESRGVKSCWIRGCPASWRSRSTN